jgi:hypothetical protein
MVIRDEIKRGNEHGAVDYPGVTLDLMAQTVAVHELTHLAGIPDLAFFGVNSEDHRSVNYLNAAPLMTTYDYFNNQAKGGWHGGWFWEEGLATLAGSMYLWAQLPSLAARKEVEIRGTDQGLEIELPLRHTVGQASQALAGWGIERLISLVPEVWDILLSSRQYASSWNPIRPALKRCIESVSPDLFTIVDQVNGGHLPEVMDAASRIDFAARKAGV